MRKVIAIIVLLFFIACNKKQGEYYTKIRKLFIESYISLDFNNFSSDRNRVELKETKKLLHNLQETSVSDEEYFFDLMNFRLCLIMNNKNEANKYIESIEKVNPMMFYFYKGIIIEFLEGNLKASRVEYLKSKDNSVDAFFSIYLSFLIKNDPKLFIDELSGYDFKAKDYYKKIYDSSEKESFRRKVIIDEVFNNFYLPKN